MDALGYLEQQNSAVFSEINDVTYYNLRVQTWITFNDEPFVNLTVHISNQVTEEASRGWA